MSSNLTINNSQSSVNSMRRKSIMHDCMEYGHIKEVTAEFSDKHPLYQKYGIRNMKTLAGDDGRRSYSISGDTYNGKNKFHFSVGTANNSEPQKVIANFLKDLAKARNFVLPKGMESIFNVAKHII